ncbi:tetratricopeptide repeat protein [Persicitalea jodogahamensis]|uniref:Tetratricopeptide repeat protein n=1 Tax=Persicitalea jodogahamensis TaxID=402147 RepID=A0A8J3DAG4_9BACT|nr:tetratricopeptide repeat protein [Persicitalea jodogahamensis]GHB75946.1 hypothetical protein GCM10007390_32250 [Persicitalea jodogahamensis]
METSFLEKLLSFYEEDPDDPFNLYALALEYQKSDATKAAEFYRQLLTDHPDYLPTYYHAAQFFSGLEENETAESIYKKGIELAVKQQNSKAHLELSRAYRTFEDEQMEW